MIRKILVPFRNDGKGSNVIAHAAALAQDTNAHVVVAHCRARPEDMLPFGVPIPNAMKKQMLEQAQNLADLEEQGLKDEFAALVASLNLKVSEPSKGKFASAEWIEESGRQVDIIRHHGRLADLIAVAQPDVDRNLGANTLKAALFHTGRPVLMCPETETPPTVLGENVTIAWNGSTEAARAVALTLPLTRHAKTITILTTGDMDKVPGAGDLQAYFKEHGITAAIKEFPAGKNIAKDLLSNSEKLGADLMIMGAYGDSHERETLFGGNTQTVVDHAKIPVVLVH